METNILIEILILGIILNKWKLKPSKKQKKWRTYLTFLPKLNAKCLSGPIG